MERPASERLCTVRIGVGAAQGGMRERPSRAEGVRARARRACVRARARAQSVHDMPGTHCGSARRAGKLVVICYYKPLQAPGTWAFFGDMLARRGLVAIIACSRACSGTTSPSELVVALQAIATRAPLVTRLVVQQVWRAAAILASSGDPPPPPRVLHRAGRQTDRQTGRGRQTDRQTDGQTDIDSAERQLRARATSRRARWAAAVSSRETGHPQGLSLIHI